MKKIGFIGMGNMAQAIASGFVTKQLMQKENLYAYSPNQEKLKKNAELIGFIPMPDIKSLVDTVDTLIVACKPYQIESVFAEIQKMVADKNIVSIALGWDYAAYEKLLGASAKIQFIMPNTPAKVGEGVFLFEEKSTLSTEDRMCLMELFGALGKVVELPTALMGIGGAMTGCGPAFMDLIMEAYADSLVQYGVGRKMAYELVAQTMLGSAKLQLETGMHPGVLKDAVCSPAGSTIRGVAALEHAGIRAACMDAIDAVMNR